MKFRHLFLFAMLVIAAAACGGSDAPSTNEVSSNPGSADAPDAVDSNPDVAESAATESAASAVTTTTDAAEVAEPVRGTATVAATVTIGDETFTFDVVSCTLGTEVDGQIYGPKVAGGFTADATMSMVVSNDPDVGDRVTVTDVSFDEVMSRFDSTIEFTEVIFDGESFSGTGEFIDKASDSEDRLPGTVSGTCS